MRTETNESLYPGDRVINEQTGTPYRVTGTRTGTVWLRRFGTDGETVGAYIAFNPSKHRREIAEGLTACGC